MGIASMGQFENLPGVFELARMSDQKSTLTYEEYIRYLRIWEELSPERQQMCMMNARQRSRAKL